MRLCEPYYLGNLSLIISSFKIYATPLSESKLLRLRGSFGKEHVAQLENSFRNRKMSQP